MKVVNAKTGEVEDLTPQQAQAAFLSRTHGFESGARLPTVSPDGSVGMVKAENLHQFLSGGGRLAGEDEVRSARLDQKYGGVGGTLAAGGEAIARGATVGLSDPLAVGAARLFGGEEAAEATRTHLAEEKEAHPVLSTAGELAGTVGGALLTGGATAEAGAAETAVEATSAGSKLLRAVGALGAPVRGVEAAGGLAERGVAAVTDRLLGSPAARGALKRVVAGGAKQAARFGTEGALFGAGQEVSETALGDHELNAEKMAAAIGHGALYGAMTGGVLGAGGQALREGAGTILSRVSPHLDSLADSEAWRALHPKLGATKEAIARAGGEREVGATARKFGILGDSIADATAEPEELLSRTKKAQEQVGGQIDQILTSSDAKVDSRKILKPLEDKIDELEQTAAGKSVAAPLRKFRDDLEGTLGVTEGKEVQKSPEMVRQWLKDNPEIVRASGGNLPREALFEPAVKVYPEVPIQKLVEERRSLAARVYEQTKSQNAPLHIEQLREFHGQLRDLETETLNETADKLDATTTGATTKPGDELRNLNKDYQRLKLIEKTQTERVATQATNQRASLTDKMFGAAHFAGALAAGHPLGALTAGGTVLASKLVREKGNAMAAIALGRLSKLDLVSRATKSVDEELGEGLTAFATRKTKAQRVAAVAQDVGEAALRQRGGAPLAARYNAAKASTPQNPTPLGLADVEKAIPGLSQHAPLHALALGTSASRAAAWLAAHQPKAHGVPSVLGGSREPPEQEQEAFVRQHQAVHDPVGTIGRALKTGSIQADEVQAIAETKPRLYAEVQQRILETVADHRDSMNFDKVQLLSKIAGMPLDPSLAPEAVAYYQSSWMTSASSPSETANAHVAPTVPKRALKGSSGSTALTPSLVSAA